MIKQLSVDCQSTGGFNNLFYRQEVILLWIKCEMEHLYL